MSIQHPTITTAETRVVAVVGPTAVGKTTLAEELCVRLGGQIVSADSMQVYRKMDIGTAKPPQADRRVPYHCIDLVDPGTPFSAALYQDAARSAIAVCAASGALPVICGGTGLYVRAALDDWRFPSGELSENPQREQWESLAAERGPEVLHAQLEQLDPASAALIHPNNVRRVIRALEMFHEGVRYADQRAGFDRRRSVYDAAFLGLDIDRSVLYERIDARVDAMMADGLLDEVAGLLASGLRSAITAQQAIGYKELVPVLETGADLEQAIADIRQASRRYAKRQLSWFRGDARIRWIDVTELSLAQAADAAQMALDWEDST